MQPSINHINCLKTKNTEVVPSIIHLGAPAEKIARKPIIIKKITINNNVESYEDKIIEFF